MSRPILKHKFKGSGEPPLSVQTMQISLSAEQKKSLDEIKLNVHELNEKKFVQIDESRILLDAISLGLTTTLEAVGEIQVHFGL